MNLNRLRYFISVYEEESITKAAKKEFITQVAMSQQIRALETELDIELFVREKNRLYPTTAAHYLYQEARKLLHSYDTLISDIKSYKIANKKILRMGINYYSIYEWAKPYTKQFEETYSNISIIFEFNPSNELLSKVDKGYLDVILILDDYASNLGLYTCSAFTSKGVILIPEGSPLYDAGITCCRQLAEQHVVILIEELPFFKRTGHLDALLDNIYHNTSLRREDLIITDNINQALLLASEEHYPIVTYEDKLYKIDQKTKRTVYISDAFMHSRFVFAWKQEEDNAIRKLFIIFIRQACGGV